MSEQPDPRSRPIADIPGREVPPTVLAGFCMGTADVVPGVSGGTMAVALGVYHQLLAAIASANARAARALLGLRLREALGVVHWRFLLSLVSGIALAVAVMVKVVRLPELIVEQPKYVYAVFFGLVLASTIALARHIGRWSIWRGAALIAGAALGFGVVNLVPTSTPDHALFVFLCGAVAICAMLLPGISGSFILLILGKYAYVLAAVGHLDMRVLLPFGFGCLVGILSFSRLLNWLLNRWHDTVLAVLIGLLFGSLWRIWPYQHLTTEIVRDKPRVVAAQPFLPEGLEPSVLLLCAGGVAFVLAIEWYAARRRRREAEADAAHETA